jgi:protein-tyrosine phosphatase
MVKVIFICTGNICRSPTAEGVFSTMVATKNLGHRIDVDSVGTKSWHTGNPPDKRSQLAASKRGYDLANQRSRLINDTDITESDYLIAMDTSNMESVKKITQQKFQNKIFLFLEFAPHLNYKDVPDPYYSGVDGFDLVLDLVEESSKFLLSHIQNHNL